MPLLSATLRVPASYSILLPLALQLSNGGGIVSQSQNRRCDCKAERTKASTGLSDDDGRDVTEQSRAVTGKQRNDRRSELGAKRTTDLPIAADIDASVGLRMIH